MNELADEPVFVAAKALPTAPSGQHLSRLCAGLGLRIVHYHAMQHTLASRLVIAGVNPSPVRELMGDIQTVR